MTGLGCLKYITWVSHVPEWRIQWPKWTPKGLYTFGKSIWLSGNADLPYCIGRGKRREWEGVRTTESRAVVWKWLKCYQRTREYNQGKAKIWSKSTKMCSHTKFLWGVRFDQFVSCERDFRLMRSACREMAKKCIFTTRRLTELLLLIEHDSKTCPAP